MKQVRKGFQASLPTGFLYVNLDVTFFPLYPLAAGSKEEVRDGDKLYPLKP